MKILARMVIVVATVGLVVLLWSLYTPPSTAQSQLRDPAIVRSQPDITPLLVKGGAQAPERDFRPEVTESGSPPSPAEVMAGMEVPEGFRMELFASEPQVRVPIDMTLDDAGRVWVAEAYSYMDWPRTTTRTTTHSFGNQTTQTVRTGAGTPRDRIVVLSDTDGDGRADDRKVAIKGLSHLSSLAVGWGGVWVLNLPNLEFYPDPDGDGIIDGDPITKLSGFATRGLWNMPNSLTWGPDGWLYGLSGQLGWSHIRDQQFSCGVWRYHPVEDRFEVVANGMTNPWGIDWNADGDCFVSGNCNGHLWAIHHGGFYERGWGGGRMTMGSQAFTSIAMVPHYPPDSSWKRAWEKRFEVGDGADAYGGGHSHSGLLIYQGGRWPQEYWGQTLMVNIFGHRLNVDTLEWEGRYLSRRQSDLMKAETEWFKGVSVEQDIDGNVLVSDWCDKGECHDQTGVHRSSGRIYRLVYGEKEKRESLDLRAVKDELVLLDLLKDDNNYYQRRASRLMMERLRAGDFSASGLQALLVVSQEGKSWQERLIALQTLAGGGKLSLVAPQALADSDARVRAAAVRLLASEKELLPLRDGKTLAALNKLFAEEENERVIWQLAAALRHPSCSLGNVFSLLPRSTHPRLTRLLWQTTGGVGRLSESDLLEFYQKSPDRIGRLEAISGLVDLGAGKELALVLKSVPQLVVEEGNEVLEAVAAGSERSQPSLTLDEWRVLRGKLVAWGNEETARQLISLGRVFRDEDAFAQAQGIAQAQNRTSAERVSALEEMLLFDPSRSTSDFAKLWHEPELRMGIIPLLTELGIGFSYFVERSARELTSEERRALVKEMLESPQGAAELMNQINAGTFSAQEMQGGNLALLEVVAPDLAEEFRNRYGANNADELWQRARRALASGEGDAKAGETTFQRLCSQCHCFQGGKGTLGPDLSGYDFSDSDALLRNIIYPSEVVALDARMTVVTLADGAVVTGTSLGETVTGDVRLKTISGEKVIPRDRLVERKTFAQSLMPEGLLEGLSDEDIRGLFRYLQGGGE